MTAPMPSADARLSRPAQCKEDGGLGDFLDAEQLALWPLSRGNRDTVRKAGCVYGSLKYGWDLRAKLHPRVPMEDLIADALERVRPATCCRSSGCGNSGGESVRGQGRGCAGRYAPWSTLLSFRGEDRSSLQQVPGRNTQAL